MQKGTKVHLRELHPSDVDLIYAWENDKNNWKVSGTTEPYTFEEIVGFVNEEQNFSKNQQQRFIICLNDSNLPIGTMDIFEYNSDAQSAGVGVLIASNEYRNKGFAKEALQLLISHAKDSFHLTRLNCKIHSDNESSIRLFTNAGFTLTEIRKDWYIHNGIKIDEHEYQLWLKK